MPQDVDAGRGTNHPERAPVGLSTRAAVGFTIILVLIEVGGAFLQAGLTGQYSVDVAEIEAAAIKAGADASEKGARIGADAALSVTLQQAADRELSDRREQARARAFSLLFLSIELSSDASSAQYRVRRLRVAPGDQCMTPDVALRFDEQRIIDAYGWVHAFKDLEAKDAVLSASHGLVAYNRVVDEGADCSELADSLDALRPLLSQAATALDRVLAAEPLGSIFGTE